MLINNSAVLRTTTACRLRRIRASAQSQRMHEINGNFNCQVSVFIASWIRLMPQRCPSASLVRWTQAGVASNISK